MRQSTCGHNHYSGHRMNCEQLSNGSCLIASRLAGRAVIVTPNWCIHCSAVNPPQQINPVTMSLAKSHAKPNKRASVEFRQAEDKEQRRSRVEQATKRKAWVISWLKLLRSPQDKGLGDTAARLVKQRIKSKPWIVADAHNAITCILKQCSCSRVDAVKRLNDRYPY